MRINTPVTITLHERVYPSMVQGLDETGIWLAMPLSGRTLVRPRRGQELTVSLSDEYGRHTFKVVVLDRRVKDPPLIQVSWPDEIQRMQNRRAFRLEVGLRVRWRAEGAEEWDETQSRDLSAGGVLVAGHPRQEWAGRIEVEIFLPGCPVQAMSRLVRLDPDATALEFTDIALSSVDAVVAFLFEEQRRRRSLGLL